MRFLALLALVLLPLAASAAPIKVPVVWAPASGPVDHYELETSPDGIAWEMAGEIPVPPASQPPRLDIDWEPGTPLHLRVRAVGDDGTEQLSDANEVTVQPPPAPPLGKPGTPTIIVIQ